MNTRRFGITILLLVLFSVSSVNSQELPDHATEKLIEHLTKKGFNHLVVRHLGESLAEESQYAFHEVSCRYEISRCRVVYQRMQGKKKLNDVFIWFRIDSPRMGWRAISNIPKGQEINEMNVEWGMTNAVPCSNLLALKNNLPFGKSLGRDLKAGDTLCLHDLEQGNDVKKNQMVKLVSRSIGFDLVLSAKSLDTGDVGDTVRVRIPGAANILRAVVIGKKQVELSL
ncbi:flagellar basal body P-ring formation chaperone FlgA [Vibrio caribbeanicus]|uniref:flagellar basal body P-ring formation chaperone FlgA n=1 Tax=Vibrio caribbeanicus TaxID=701175 RepID=UPI0030DDCA3A